VPAGSIIVNGWTVLKSSIPDCCKENSDSLEILIEVLHDDQEIMERVVQLLQMDSYQRREMLNIWLEKLQRKHAPPGMIQALTCLFDDTVAKIILSLFVKRYF
jgi:hypothetical protein